MHHAAYLNSCEFEFKSSQEEEAPNGRHPVYSHLGHHREQPDTFMPLFEETSHDVESSLYLPNDFKCY